MTYRIRNIGIAIALAITAALLTLFYVTNYKRSVQQGENNVTVFVAAKDIPVGMSGADVAGGKWMSSQQVTRRSVVPGAISDPTQIQSLIATQPVYAGEQVSTRRFRPLAEQGVRAQLKGNVRALQIPGSEHQLLSGTLKPGDHVDVVGSWEYPEGSQTHVSRVVLRDLLVLRAPNLDKVSSKITSGANEPFSAMLAVTDSQAHKFFWLMQYGEWSLQLRAVAGAADSAEGIDSSASLLSDGLTRGQLKKELTFVKRSDR